MPVLAPQMREELSRSAFVLFARHGFRNVNLDAIAAGAGVTKGSLYWHYRSKKELILAACDYYYRRWQQRIQAAVARADTPLAKLQTAVRFSVDNCVINRASRVFTTEVFAMSMYDKEVRTGWAQFSDTARDLFVGLVEGAAADGSLDAPDPRRAVDTMISAVEGIKQRAVWEPQICIPRARQAIVAEMLRILGFPKTDRRGP